MTSQRQTRVSVSGRHFSVACLSGDGGIFLHNNNFVEGVPSSGLVILEWATMDASCFWGTGVEMEPPCAQAQEPAGRTTKDRSEDKVWRVIGLGALTLLVGRQKRHQACRNLLWDPDVAGSNIGQDVRSNKSCNWLLHLIPCLMPSVLYLTLLKLGVRRSIWPRVMRC